MVRIGNSSIDGQGLFAAQDITKRTRIIAYIGEKITRQESARRLEAGNAYIFHLNYRYALDGATLANSARYINHSCDPNAGIKDSIKIVAMKNIRRDEEVTFDYSTTESESGWYLICHCKNKNCRRIIRFYKFLSAELKLRYRDFISEYLK